MTYDFLQPLGIAADNLGGFHGEWTGSGAWLDVHTPIDGTRIARVRQCTVEDYNGIAERAERAFRAFRMEPAPKRGEVVRRLGEALRQHKEQLGRLVTLEMGKILPEGLGEVQEMIDVCDFAVGLSRQLYGLTMPRSGPATG